MIFADLHNHTTASDGDFTPEEMILQAREKGIKAIGITDHDTLSGLLPAVAAGKNNGVEVVCGVEVSVRFKRPYFTGTLHLLCYFSNTRLNDPDFTSGLNSILADGRGEQLVKDRIREINTQFGPGGTLARLNRNMTYEDISSLSDNATRRHFALALEKRFGICDKDAITAIIGNDSPAYLPSGVDLSSLTGFIQAHPMVVSLAHPAAGSFPGGGHYKEVLPRVEVVEKILPEFLEAGMNAIEVYYPGHSSEHTALMKAWAEKHDLIMTGGSDCHDAVQRPFGVRGLSRPEFDLFKSKLENAG